MEIRNDEHVFIAGATGSGKTFLITEYLKYPQKNLFILDTKGDLEFKNKNLVKITKLMDLKITEIPDEESKEFPLVLLYEPNIHELNEEYYNAFFKFIYELKNCTLVVDEVNSVCKNALSIPFYYKSILTRGRSRNTNVFSGSQRPRNIPIYILSECIHYFVFRLNNINDRKALKDNTGMMEFMVNPVEEHAFHYFNNKTNVKLIGKLVK